MSLLVVGQARTYYSVRSTMIVLGCIEARYTRAMSTRLQLRRTIIIITSLVLFGLVIWQHPDMQQPVDTSAVVAPGEVSQIATGDAATTLDQLLVKGRAPKTGYARAQFGNGWSSIGGCDTRNIILNRDMVDVVANEKCQVVSGVLHDPYTGRVISFARGEASSQAVQIDHVVALSNAWQTGAQQLTKPQRVQLANDPLELLAVDGPANQQKSDADAASWLPPSKPFRCQYVARQIAVKKKYDLWVTAAEKDAMQRVLMTCPGQSLPSAVQ